uniref:Uncharacterized protein n=1 Tax=Onchocerca volvulus TaxID=6282 RepID=A0A8R1XU56_ONCVO
MTLMTTRRIGVRYFSSSQSDEEPVEEVAYIDTEERPLRGSNVDVDAYNDNEVRNGFEDCCKDTRDLDYVEDYAVLTVVESDEEEDSKNEILFYKSYKIISWLCKRAKSICFK